MTDKDKDIHDTDEPKKPADPKPYDPTTADDDPSGGIPQGSGGGPNDPPASGGN